MAEGAIATRRATPSREVDPSPGLVDVLNVAHGPLAGRDAVLERAGLRIVQIQVRPPVSHREPDHLVARAEWAPVRSPTGVEVRLDERWTRLFEDRARGARACVCFNE